MVRHRHHHARRDVAVLLASLLVSLATTRCGATSAFALIRFNNCLSNSVPLFQKNNQRFHTLKQRNYLNNHAVPRAIALPRTETELARVVRCAHLTGATLCIRSGGHSLVGNSLCSGVLLDVANFKQLKFHPEPYRRNQLVVGAGVTLGEMLHFSWARRRRWLGGGVCPGVGAAGYILGGGYGPYTGSLGLACDAVHSVRMVDRFGNLKIASKDQHTELFWALCGAGGGQFGVVTSFTLRTAASRPFDRAVAFRFRWPHERVGELVEKWQWWDEDGGKTWLRLEMYHAHAGKGMVGYGACYDVANKQACMQRLQRAAFFNTPGRETLFMKATKSAVQLHAFFGPDGGWARRFAPNARNGLLGKQYTENGVANVRSHQSAFLTLRQQRKAPSRLFWQRYADTCAYSARQSSVVWTICEMTRFGNKVRRPDKPSAFSHRKADVITHFLIGEGLLADRRKTYYKMKTLLKPYSSGVYVNYPELDLGKWEYPRKYWGNNVRRLKRLKKQWDPRTMFYDSQPIPSI